MRLLLIILALALSVAAQTSDIRVAPQLLGGLQWRSIGPAMFGGRVADVAGAPGNPNLLFVAHSSGGLFKSTNGGVTFESIFNDGNTISIGAIAVAPDNPDVIYVGAGEGAVRNSISFGDGVYKSTDGGKTWRHLGLKDSERFARIVIHPANPQIVIAAAMGHAFGPNEERGVFRSTDGGATWQRTLYVNATTGASDVTFDPHDPQIVYAGMYDYLRQPWHFRSGGAGSGLYRCGDGGMTWKKLTDPAMKSGLPGARLLGRSGVAVSRSNPNVVYALIEAQEDGALWRSQDRGKSWQVVSNERRINNRPFYYTQVRVDPADENRVYTLSGSFNISTDGGRTFRTTPGASMFGDHHALWIDPTNPRRLLCGTDGGFFISNDQAARWDFVNNMPMAQPYHVGLDMAEPYNVLGGFQDHEIWRGPNERWNQVGVREGDWRRLRYMADGMYTIPDPRDPNIVYFNGHFGDITRIDMRTGEERYIQPYPPGPTGESAGANQYRFNWNSPVLMSPSDPDTLYFGGNVLFKTMDGGATWQVISPDLTTNNLEKQKSSGGPISFDNTRAEFHCTITALAESPRDRNVLWAGTDDGNVQLTRDGGKTWTNVVANIKGAPDNGWVPAIHASHTEAGAAYVAIDNHRLNDFAPYAFMTTDYGKTWRKITDGLRGYTHIVAEDPREPSLLYAGTELGIFASFDRGAHWTDLRLGAPPLAVVDLKVHPRDNDLVIATHARGFYILDDATPLQQLARALDKPAALFKPMRATRYTPASDTSVLGNRVWVARNKPYGAIINYFLKEAAGGAVELSIHDATGALVRRLNGARRAGLNRVVWDLEEAACEQAQSAGRRFRAEGGNGVRALPGEYKARLTVSGQTLEESFTVRLDPRVTASLAELELQLRENRRLAAMQCAIAGALNQLQTIDAQLSKLAQSGADAATKGEAAALQSELKTIAAGLGGDPRNPDHPNIRGKLNWLVIQVGGYSGRPTNAQLEWISRYNSQLDQLLAQFAAARRERLVKLNARLQAANLPQIN